MALPVHSPGKAMPLAPLWYLSHWCVFLMTLVTPRGVNCTSNAFSCALIAPILSSNCFLLFLLKSGLIYILISLTFCIKEQLAGLCPWLKWQVDWHPSVSMPLMWLLIGSNWTSRLCQNSWKDGLRPFDVDAWKTQVLLKESKRPPKFLWCGHCMLSKWLEQLPFD